MAKSVSPCQLVCLQKSHEPIPLPDGETVVIGRSPQTQIKDPRCSRTQLELTVNYKQRTVSVKQIGLNPSAVDGVDIGQDKVVTMGFDSTLFILASLYPHKIAFHSKNDDNTDMQRNNSLVDKSHKQGVESNKKVFTVEQDKYKNYDSSDKKDRKRGSSSKRASSDSHKQQPVEKKRKVETDVHSKVSDNRNGEQNKPSKQTNSHAQEHSTENKSKYTVLENKKMSRKMDVGDDDDGHIASVEEKLKQMKQDALREKEKLKSKTSQNIPEKVSYRVSSTKTSPLSSNTTNSSESSLDVHTKAKPSLLTSEAKKPTWDNHADYCVFTSLGVKPRDKISGFDLDGTIITTKSGKTFPQNADDWKIFLPETFKALKDLHAKNYKIVFFTNQLGVARGKTKIEDLIKKVENVVAKLQVPIQVFIATHEGRYRKPMTGMWDELVRAYNSGVSIDIKSSIYVGDAAGRQANWAPKKKKDFSCSDRLFALNIGIPFKTPEEYFQGQKPTNLFQMPEFDPRELSSDTKLLSGDSKPVSNSKEVIILVGLPASGKSHFSKNVLAPKGYVIINRDSLGTWQKCVKRTQEALVNSSVVVDNTNLTKEERARYIACAKQAKVPCRCFVFTTTVEHCRHNERFRQMTNNSHDKINEMIFNQTKKKFEEPNMNEGFTEIVNVNFVPHFTSAKDEADYKKFLLEK